MLVGYARVSKSEGSQSTDLQRDALLAAGCSPEHTYEDRASGSRDDRG
ncbi:recombinase family protein [Arthrobacter antibioticus]